MDRVEETERAGEDMAAAATALAALTVCGGSAGAAAGLDGRWDDARAGRGAGDDGGSDAEYGGGRLSGTTSPRCEPVAAGGAGASATAAATGVVRGGVRGGKASLLRRRRGSSVDGGMQIELPALGEARLSEEEAAYLTRRVQPTAPSGVYAQLVQLAPYFRGLLRLEDIMWLARVSATDLANVLNTFPAILIKAVH